MELKIRRAYYVYFGEKQMTIFDEELSDEQIEDFMGDLADKLFDKKIAHTFPH